MPNVSYKIIGTIKGIKGNCNAGHKVGDKIELGGNDLDALAALMTGNFHETPEWAGSPDELKRLLKKVKIPALTVVGSNKFIPGDKTLIAQLIPNACHCQIQGKDHLTVVPDPKFLMVVKAFLNYVNKK